MKPSMVIHRFTETLTGF